MMEIGRRLCCNLASLTMHQINQNKRHFLNTHGSCSILAWMPVISDHCRGAHTQNLTKSMQYISNDKVKFKIDPVTMKLNQKIDKPICVMMNFMLATPKAVLKYADLYLKHGYDVMAVSCQPLELMWPVRGSQVIADRLLHFLNVNDCGAYQPMVVHGFSVGAYVWSELLVHSIKDDGRYQHVLDRVAAQVWDSPADIHEIPEGVPRAMFPNSKLLQRVCRAYVTTHMKLLHNVATKHYLKATEIYHETPCKAPSLFLVSKTDPVGAAKRSRRAAAMWEERGIKCHLKCWDESPHVQHYLRHPKEYRDTLYSHLEESGAIQRQKQ